MGSLVFRITGDPSAFKAAMGEVSASLDGAARRAETVSQKMSSLGTTLSLGVTLPALALGKSLITTAANMEALRKGLDSVATAADPTSKQLERLKEVAKLPGLGFEEAIQGSVRLQSAGFSANLAERSLKAFGNALATVGRGKAELDGVALSLSQIASKGKISAEEINQLAERLPQIRKFMKDAFGTADTEVLQKAGIDWETFVRKIVEQAEKLKTVSGGTKNALENLSDKVKESADRIGQRLLPAINDILPKIETLAVGAADAVDAFTKLPPQIQNTALAIAALTIAAGPVAAIIGRITAALGALRVALGVASVGVAGLFGGAFVIGIGQALTMMDELKAKTKAINEERAAAASKGGLMPNGLAPSRESLQGVKVDVKALADELDLYGTKAKAASESAKKAAAAITDKGKAAQAATNIIKVSSVEGLIYVESLERVKTAVSKIKDVMYEWSIQGTSLGKMLEYHRAPLDNLAIAADDYRLALSKARFELEALGKMPAIQMATPTQPERRGTILEAGDILRDIGGSDPVELRRKADQAAAGYERLIELQKQGKATTSQVQAAYEAWGKAEQAASGRASASAKAQTAALRQVSTVITDLSRGIARSIIEWKGWGEMLKGVAKSSAEAIIRQLVEGALNKLAKKLIDVGGIAGKVFGSSGGGVPGVTAVGLENGGLGKLPGFSGTSGTGGATGAASGGIMGAIGVVSGVVSAVSGVIGNFQMYGMNKTLDLIEKEVRYSQIHLLNLLEKNNEYLPNLKNIWESLIRMETRQMEVGAGGGLVINITGNTFGAGTSQAQVKALFTAAVNEMKLKGLTK
jgi:tape measure domain-containing protein